MIKNNEEKLPKSKIDLRKLMEKLGMGTNAFAEACGVSTQSMAQYLRVESLTTKTIYKMATALDIDPRDMFFPTEEDTNVTDNGASMNEDVTEDINIEGAMAGFFVFGGKKFKIVEVG